MTSEFEDEAKIVAYHEAGHAIMAIACGFKITALSIDASDVGKGFVAYQIPAPVDAVTAKKAALVSAAGLAADIHLAGKSGKPRPNGEFRGHFNDQKMAAESIRLSGGDGNFDGYLLFAGSFLNDNWSFVESVAEPLFHLKTFRPDALDISKFPTLPDNWLAILDQAFLIGKTVR